MLSTNFLSLLLCSTPGESDSCEEGITSRRRKRAQNKLDPAAVRQIRAEGATPSAVNSEQLGRRYGVSVSTIKAVLNRKTWKNVE